MEGVDTIVLRSAAAAVVDAQRQRWLHRNPLQYKNRYKQHL